MKKYKSGIREILATHYGGAKSKSVHMHCYKHLRVPYYRRRRMAIASDEIQRTERIPLINGSSMTCPRCRKSFNILAFQRLEMPSAFEQDLTPVYKCPKTSTGGGCGYLFAPAESAIQEYISPTSEEAHATDR
jgi:hypothetical protein